MKKPGIGKKFGYLWVTLLFFLVSIIGHWTAAWFAYIEEQAAHAQPVELNNFLVVVVRDTLENWQSEFLQLIWQVAGLSFLWYVGSPQSKENSERLEEKVDFIARNIKGKEGEKIIARLDSKYPKN